MPRVPKNKQRRNPKAGWVRRQDLPKGSNGNALCRKCSKETPTRRHTFCSATCVHEWKLRSSAQYVRQCLKKRDKGVCGKCGLDTYALTRGLRQPLKGETADEWRDRVARTRIQHNIPEHRLTLWDADHVIPVAEGGGQCGLENYVTLCYWCHQSKTKEQAARRAEVRAKKKPKPKAA